MAKAVKVAKVRVLKMNAATAESTVTSRPTAGRRTGRWRNAAKDMEKAKEAEAKALVRVIIITISVVRATTITRARIKEKEQGSYLGYWDGGAEAQEPTPWTLFSLNKQPAKKVPECFPPGLGIANVKVPDDNCWST